jgi:hypothetical protein
MAALLGIGLCISGCVLGPPIQLEEQEQIPPRALTDQAAPTTMALYQTSSSQDIYFSVPFDSEDLGEPINGFLYLNYQSERPLAVGANEVPPSTISAGNREMSIQWTDLRTVPAGCYVMTMAITYASNYTRGTVQVPRDETKTAFISWWIVHDVAPQAVNMDECLANAGGTTP